MSKNPFIKGMTEFDDFLGPHLFCSNSIDEECNFEKMEQLLTAVSATSDFSEMGRPYFASRLKQLPGLGKSGGAFRCIGIYNKTNRILTDFMSKHTATWIKAELNLNEQTRKAYDAAAEGLLSVGF